MLCRLKDTNLETSTLFSFFLTCRICQRWCWGEKNRGVENGHRENIIPLFNRVFRIFTFCAIRNWSLGRIFPVSR